MTIRTNRRSFLLGGAILAGNTLANQFGAGSPLIAAARAEAMRPATLIKASSNENPYGPSRVALKAINAAMKEANRYGGISDKLIGLQSAIEDVPEECITVANGSGEILKVSGLIASLEPGSIVCADPTYEDLPRYAGRYGTQIIRVPVDEDSLFCNLDAMYAAIRPDTRLVYLCNPNNPIPSIIEKNALRDFVLEVSKDRLVFVDEAYYEYVNNPDYGSMMELVRAGTPNLIVARTASKIHGIAGLRIGFGFSTPQIINSINEKKTSDLNIIGQHAAYASYQDMEFQDFARARNREALDIVEGMFDSRGIRYVKSNANFTFFETGLPIEDVRSRLREEGILIGRPFPPYTKWARVSMQKPEEMQYFAETYARLFG